MTRFERLILTSRVCCLAVILGLSLALFDTAAVRGTLLLSAVSAAAVAGGLATPLRRTSLAVIEGVLAALIVGVALPEGLVLLPYLVVPSLIVGLAAGMRAVLAVVAGEAVALAVVVVTAGTTDGVLPTRIGVGALALHVAGSRAALCVDA